MGVGAWGCAPSGTQQQLTSEVLQLLCVRACACVSVCVCVCVCVRGGGGEGGISSVHVRVYVGSSRVHV